MEILFGGDSSSVTAMNELTQRWGSLVKQGFGSIHFDEVSAIQVLGPAALDHPRGPGSRVIRALDPSGVYMGGLWYSKGCEADPGGLTINALDVESPYRRQGVATGLLNHMYELFEGHAVDPGGFTQEGTQLWNRWIPSVDAYEVNGCYWLEPEPDFDE
jgi:GNAT superfamily N-acetyltransferase